MAVCQMSDKDAVAEYKAAKARAKALRPWYKRKRVWFLAFVILAILGSATSKHGSPTSASSTSQSSVTTNSDQTTSTTTTDQVTAPAAPSETAGQQNAREKAAEYLSNEAFSRSGLIDQLKFEGFSVADSTYGVDAQNADWNQEAVLKAKDYLSNEAFSHSGLVEQLEFEGVTASQAEYGVTGAGL